MKMDEFPNRCKEPVFPDNYSNCDFCSIKAFHWNSILGGEIGHCDACGMNDCSLVDCYYEP